MVEHEFTKIMRGLGPRSTQGLIYNNSSKYFTQAFTLENLII